MKKRNDENLLIIRKILELTKRLQIEMAATSISHIIKSFCSMSARKKSFSRLKNLSLIQMIPFQEVMKEMLDIILKINGI